MPIVRTDLRDKRERAGEIRFYPANGVTATDVQGAIEEVAVGGGTVPPSLTPTVVTFAQSPYTILDSDYLILCATAGGAITIQTKASSTRNGREVDIKDSDGAAATNNISILRTGAETIDGMTSYPIDTNYGAANLRPIANGYSVT